MSPADAPAPWVRLMGAGYGPPESPILAGLTWEWRPGQSWGVLGANGAGKSTFLRLARGDVWPAQGQGQRLYALDGQPEASPLAMRAASRLVSAELLDAYRRRGWNLSVMQTVLTGFFDTPYLHREPTPDQRAAARRELAALGLAGLAGEPVLRLSRGQAKLVLLARGLVAQPRFIFLDEGLEALDAPTRRRMLARLAAEQARGAALAMASHRAADLLPGLSHALVLERGRIAAQGPREQVAPPPARPVQPARPAPPPPPTAGGNGHGFLVRVSRADVHLEGRRVLTGIDWQIKAGEHWAVLGPNGAGKTSLLRLLAGELLPALGGRVEWFGGGPRPSLGELRRRVGLVSADLQTGHKYAQTGLETAISGAMGSIGLNARPSAPQTAAARRWLDRLGLAHLAGRDVRGLSYGELRRFIIARAMVGEPRLLLLDEPFAGLDQAAREEVAELLTHLAGSGVGLVLVTHHAEDILPCVGHVLELEGGRVARMGARERAEAVG
ncbi:MAG: ATP-binding cassette domain-containing protein [Thermodesulfobacteriota bacterium]